MSHQRVDPRGQDQKWQVEDERVEREMMSLHLTEQLAKAQLDLVQSQPT